MLLLEENNENSMNEMIIQYYVFFETVQTKTNNQVWTYLKSECYQKLQLTYGEHIESHNEYMSSKG